MFKLVVLCAFVAATVAEVPLLYSGLVQPYSSYSTVVSPASTSISSQSSSVVHPSPISYAAPFYSHFIKKRSAQYLAPAYNTAYYPNYPVTSYVSTAPLVQAPIAYSSAHLPLAAHLIKKRSAQFFPASYYTPSTYIASQTIGAPLLSSPYLRTPYYASASVPVVNAHLIKKRSATFLPTSYFAPSTYTVASPYLAAPGVLTNTLYSAPAPIPLAATHLIKKRSADPEPEPEAKPEAKPQTLITPYFGSYSSPYYTTYPAAATFVKSTPYFAANPFFYSTYIKK